MNGADIVRARLQAISAVTTLVSTRIYEFILPQNTTLAAVRISMIPGAAEEMHLRGRTGVIVDRVQVDAYASLSSTDPLGDARAIADAIYGDNVGGVATGLEGWAGSIGSPAMMVDLIEHAFGPLEVYMPDELRQTVVTNDYYVHYRA